MRDMFGMMGDMFGGLIPGIGAAKKRGGLGGLMDKIPGMGSLKQLNALRKLAQNPEALSSMFGGGGMPGMGAGLGLAWAGFRAWAGCLPGSRGGLPNLGGTAGWAGTRRAPKGTSTTRRSRPSARPRSCAQEEPPQVDGGSSRRDADDRSRRLPARLTTPQLVPRGSSSSMSSGPSGRVMR
jgi:hypothetical protein